MADALDLVGFKHSVYTWVVRLALAEMGLDSGYTETNPFAEPPDPVLARCTPFQRVPVLQHGQLCLTETTAILRYLDAISTGSNLQPDDPVSAALMNQIIGIADADVYPVMVRQVFSQGYYMPVVEGQKGDAAIVADGFSRARPALEMLERIASEGRQLNKNGISLADLHLAPMLGYFVRVPAAGDVMASYPSLAGWLDWVSQRSAFVSTHPFGAG